MAKEESKKRTKRPTALKRDIQNEKKRLINKSFKSEVRSAIRTFEATVTKGDKTATEESLKTVYSLMDKGTKRGIFKKNKAGRTKARLAARAAKA